MAFLTSIKDNETGDDGLRVFEIEDADGYIFSSIVLKINNKNHYLYNANFFELYQTSSNVIPMLNYSLQY